MEKDLSAKEGITDSQQKKTAKKKNKEVVENESNSKQQEAKNLPILHSRAKALGEKLSLRRNEMQQHQMAVQQSLMLQQQNDSNARKAILQLQAATNVALPAPLTPDRMTNGIIVHPISAQRPKEKPNLTRSELEAQVNALQALVVNLTFHDPQLQAQVHQLVQGNSTLRSLELLPHAVLAKVNREAAYSNIGQRPHLDSASSVSSSQQKQQTSSLNSNPNNSALKGKAASAIKKTRKRNNRSKKECQSTQREVLAKYINTIVAGYLGEQHDLIKELQFNGSFNELEGHAQRLVEAGLGRIVTDEIRINRKNNRQSFVTMSTDRENSERDCIILSPVARGYAFDGDIVRAFVMNADVVSEKKQDNKGPQVSDRNNLSLSSEDVDASEDTDSLTELDTTAVIIADNCPKGFVIAITKQSSNRQIIGSISFQNNTKLSDDCFYYKLKPHDMRVPMVYIPIESCASHVTAENKNDICGFLYVAVVLETNEQGRCIGNLLQPVGRVGNLEAEIKAILLHNGLKDVGPFEQRFNDMFAAPDQPINKNDLEQREDLRKNCIFTIDPLTARDLDDAMSVEQVAEDEYEVGVHISDVSHYLLEDTELDNIVKDRATSIYLVTEVIHMLPQTLCFKCSLLPGEDKYSFSVFWRMSLLGDIIGQPRFTRSVINSCTQLAYEHAQKIIDNPNEEFEIDDFPTIYNGYTPSDIATRVRILDAIAHKMREKRYNNGALSINNPKLRFNLDGKSGEPLNYEIDSRLEANFLIEEFMLLANQSVARFIHERFPDSSILRSHAQPLGKSMRALREKLANIGIEFNESSSKTVYESMQRICSESSDPVAMDAFLNTMLTKPMARAKYFCSEGKTEEADLWHYALSIPIYTHFTSPIRRYPDILVHRLLAAALNYCPPPKRTAEELHHIAKVCNDQKFNAKNAGDESINLFFKRYIKAHKWIVLRAVVTEIFQHLVNVVIIQTGHTIAVNYKMQQVIVNTANVPAFITLHKPKSKSTPPVKLQLFSTVDIRLEIYEGRICGFFELFERNERQLNQGVVSKSKQRQMKENIDNAHHATTPQDNNEQASGKSNTDQCTNDKKHTKHSKSKTKQKLRMYSVNSNCSDPCNSN